ncbi:MAG: TlpA family protein disulfide reductase [Bryobacteraceae bacterium]
MRNIAICIAGLAFAAGSLLAQNTSARRKAPEFAFSIPGHGQKLLSQYRGKVVALEFIFTTCPHCQAAAKLMTKFQQEYGPRGLQVIDVAVNQNADLLVDDFARDFHVNFPVGWALRDQAASFMNFASGYFVVPQLALIDRKGYIRYQTPATETPDWDKLMNEPSLRRHIQDLLSQGGSASTHRGDNRVAGIRKAS